jgi:hypothetical protein
MDHWKKVIKSTLHYQNAFNIYFFIQNFLVKMSNFLKRFFTGKFLEPTLGYHLSQQTLKYKLISIITNLINIVMILLKK